MYTFNPQIKEKFWRNKHYRKFISTKPCARCGRLNPPNDDGHQLNDPHHERALGGGGTAIKPPDSHTIPLCHECHVLRDGWKGPVFPHIEDWEESFYPETVDVKMLIIDYLTEFIMERYHGLQKK